MATSSVYGRQLFRLNKFRGVNRAAVVRDAMPPDELVDARGFIIDNQHKLRCEPRWYGVPQEGLPSNWSPDPDAPTNEDRNGYRIFQAFATQYSGADNVAAAGLIYMAAQKPTSTLGVWGEYEIWKTLRQASTDSGVNWVRAHGTPPPWGTGVPVMAASFTAFNGKVFWASASTGPPNAEGGLYVDPATGDFASSVSQFAKVDVPWAPHLVVNHANRLFAAMPDPQGGLLRFSVPGSAHQSGDWPPNNFMYVGPGEGYNVFGMVSLPDRLIILKDQGIWVLEGTNPSDWFLYKIADISCAGMKSVWRDPRGFAFFFLDAQNRLWRWTPDQLVEIGRKQNRYRDISDWIGDFITPVVGVGDLLYAGAIWPMHKIEESNSSPPASNPGTWWKREGMAMSLGMYGPQPEGNLPWIINTITGDSTRSLQLKNWTGVDASAAEIFQWGRLIATSERGLNFGGKTTNMVFTDAHMMSVNIPTFGSGAGINTGIPIYALHSVSNLVYRAVWPRWNFGEAARLKRIHGVKVLAEESYEPEDRDQQVPRYATMRWFFRAYTPRGVTDWIPMAIIDEQIDPASWTPNYEIPADDYYHSLSLSPGDPTATSLQNVIDLDVYWFQLRMEYHGTNPANGIVLKEIVVDYEVVVGMT